MEADVTIGELDAAAAQAQQAALCHLLRDAVEGGASVGFVLPLHAAELEGYWQGIVGQVQAGATVLFGAWQGGQLLGTVQLTRSLRSNGRHRAEVQKLLVHSSARRRGIARQLMRALEARARASGITLLVLDTCTGEAAELLYVQLGFTRVGSIPSFAAYPDGRLGSTTYYYRLLS